MLVLTASPLDSVMRTSSIRETTVESTGSPRLGAVGPAEHRGHEHDDQQGHQETRDQQPSDAGIHRRFSMPAGPGAADADG